MREKQQPEVPGLVDADEYARRHLEAAGRRAAVPAEIVDQITETARAAWQSRWAKAAPAQPTPTPIDRDRGAEPALVRPSYWPRLAMAATVLLALSAGTWWWLSSAGDPSVGIVDTSVGIVERSIGQVSIVTTAETASQTLAAGSEVAADSWIETGESGQAALRLTSGVSLRVDRNTRLRLASTDQPDRIAQIDLTRGAVYFDTGRSPGASPGSKVTIETPVGAAWDLGTQFELRLLETDGSMSMRIRVREGSVEAESNQLSRSDQLRHRAQAGEELLVHADGSAGTRPIAVYGEHWQWVLDSAPAIEIASVGELLAWTERETGWQIRFADPGIEAAAKSRDLSFGTSDVRPDQAATFLPVAGLEASLEAGVLTIRAVPSSH